jgi:hypothetical protein
MTTSRRVNPTAEMKAGLACYKDRTLIELWNGLAKSDLSKKDLYDSRAGISIETYLDGLRFELRKRKIEFVDFQLKD